MSAVKPPRLNLNALIVSTILSAFFYAAMEWVFFVTKPSALSLLAPFEKIRVLFAAGGAFALAALFALFLLLVPALPARDAARRRLVYLACLAPAFVASVNALILFDNFTYTVFKFGIVTAVGYWRIPYLVGFLAFLVWMTARIHARAYKRRKPASLLTFGLLAVSLIALLSAASPAAGTVSASGESPASAKTYPNVIILGGDGLSASYLSVYGSLKETTPFLEKLAEESLVAKNAFVNVSSTTASTASMLTGKYPMDVKVFRYPDSLMGTDSFEHLPGILRSRGYQTVEIGTPDYVDAGALNLLDGFEVVNNRAVDRAGAGLVRRILGSAPSAQFVSAVLGRAEDRLLHIFFIWDMRNPILEVNDPRSRMTDAQRVEQIGELLERRDRPLFIFAHFMDTHGPYFSSELDTFSPDETEEDEKEWDRDEYRDAILSFDANVERIYRRLEETGQLENTILVVYTDHGFMYTVTGRVPILIRFPKQERAGVRQNNLQVIDVPVTLLDYLGIPKPAWMSGLSFLDSEAPARREIVSLVGSSPKKIGPPFFQIKTVVFVVCQKYYALNVQENKLETNMVADHTARCDPGSLPTGAEMRAEIVAYLKAHGYDVSSLEGANGHE